MKNMIKSQRYFEKQLHLNRYSNGQLAVFIISNRNEPIAELSIMHDSVELELNEFILKDYSENVSLVNKFLEEGLFNATNRFVLVGSHLCSIYRIPS